MPVDPDVDVKFLESVGKIFTDISKVPVTIKRLPYEITWYNTGREDLYCTKENQKSIFKRKCHWQYDIERYHNYFYQDLNKLGHKDPLTMYVAVTNKDFFAETRTWHYAWGWYMTPLETNVPTMGAIFSLFRFREAYKQDLIRKSDASALLLYEMRVARVLMSLTFTQIAELSNTTNMRLLYDDPRSLLSGGMSVYDMDKKYASLPLSIQDFINRKR